MLFFIVPDSKPLVFDRTHLLVLLVADSELIVFVLLVDKIRPLLVQPVIRIITVGNHRLGTLVIEMIRNPCHQFLRQVDKRMIRQVLNSQRPGSLFPRMRRILHGCSRNCSPSTDQLAASSPKPPPQPLARIRNNLHMPRPANIRQPVRRFGTAQGHCGQPRPSTPQQVKKGNFITTKGFQQNNHRPSSPAPFSICAVAA